MTESSRSSHYRTSSSFPVYGILKGFHPTSFRSHKTTSHYGHYSFSEEHCQSDAVNLDRHTSASHVHFEDEIASPRHAHAPRQWPPPGLNYHSKLTGEEAEVLICKGACVFEGFLSQAPHGSAGHVRYNAFPSTVGGMEKNIQPDCTSMEFLGKMAIARIDSVECCSPWEFLAQPVMASPFGAQPGTITLDHWVSMAGHPVMVVEDTEEGLAKPRAMEFFHVLSRLEQLQHGEISGDPTEREYSLYALLVSDASKLLSYENNMDQEILALSNCLNHSFWVDFSLASNQANIVTHYESQDPQKALFFFQQLLLGIELYLRLQSDLGSDTRTMEILSCLPLRVAWTVALAQIWLSTAIVERSGEDDHVSDAALPFRVRILDISRRKARLISLAQALKWPYLRQVETALRHTGNNNLMCAHTTHPSLMSFLSGVILPGPSTSHILIQSLISLGPTSASSILLPLFSSSPTISGFQYSGTTYWHCTSILGKVLAASYFSSGFGIVAGWVGPCAQSDDLEECQGIYVVTNTEVMPGRGMKKRKVKSLLLRSDALGPRDEIYPVDDYAPVVLLPPIAPPPDIPSSRSNTTIRITKIGFRPSPNPRAGANNDSSFSNQYEAAIFFRIASLTYPIRLRHNISFISSSPCTSGPHVLFHDYTYFPIHISSLVHLKRWGPFDSSPSSPSSSSSSPSSSFSSYSFSSSSSREQEKQSPTGSSATTSFSSSSESSTRTEPSDDDNLSDAVILIQISGAAAAAAGRQGDVLARAWCSFYGFSAVVATEHEEEEGGGVVEGTCMACAIRQAYACCVNVVIYRGQGRSGKQGEEREGAYLHLPPM